MCSSQITLGRTCCISYCNINIACICSICVLQNMSAFVERPVEMSKAEWLESLQRLQVTRTDMNRLVMNYLVTGTDFVGFFFVFFLLSGKIWQCSDETQVCWLILHVLVNCQVFYYAVCLYVAK